MITNLQLSPEIPGLYYFGSVTYLLDISSGFMQAAAKISCPTRGTCDALISLCIEMGPLDGPLAAPCFVANDKNSVLQDQRIAIKIGRIKN